MKTFAFIRLEFSVYDTEDDVNHHPANHAPELTVGT